MWTKDEIKQIIEMWEKYTVQEMMKKLNLREDQVHYMAAALRKAGFVLPRKHRNGNLSNLIQEIHSEMYGKK